MTVTGDMVPEFPAASHPTVPVVGRGAFAVRPPAGRTAACGRAVAFLLMVALHVRVSAQTPRVQFRTLAGLEHAVAMAIDPAGQLYISEGTTVTLRDSAGVFMGIVAEGTAGDPIRPSGVDPTNGLILVVADPERGRVARFARDGRFIEALEIGDRTGSAGDVVFGRHEAARTGRSVGRPVDVAVTDDDRLFVLDARVPGIRVYDASRRLLRSVGVAFGDEWPARPTALATDGGRVFVADAELPGIVVLDRFGTPISRFGEGVGERPVCIATGDSGLWMVVPGRLLLFSFRGVLERETGLPDHVRPVDVAESNGRLYLLTERSLLVLPLPSTEVAHD